MNAPLQTSQAHDDLDSLSREELTARLRESQAAASANWEYIQRVEHYLIGSNLLTIRHEGGPNEAAQNVIDSIEDLRRTRARPHIESCARLLEQKADRLEPPGKRTNQMDRHVADVLRHSAEELRGLATLSTGAASRLSASPALRALAPDVRDVPWASNCAGEIFLSKDGEKGLRIGHFQGDAALAEFVVKTHNAVLSTELKEPAALSSAPRTWVLFLPKTE